MGSKAKVTVVGAKSVRAWARENMDVLSNLTVTKKVKGAEVEVPVNLAPVTGGPEGRGRGRIAKGGPIVAAYLAANPGHKYTEGVESVPTIDVPTFDKRGRKTGRTKSIPLSEFRTLSGQKMGKPSQASVEAAGRAVSAASRKG